MKAVKEIFKNLGLAILLHLGPITIVVIVSGGYGLLGRLRGLKDVGAADIILVFIGLIFGIILYYNWLKSLSEDLILELDSELGAFISLIYLGILIITIIGGVNTAKDKNGYLYVALMAIGINLLIYNFYLVKLTEFGIGKILAKSFELSLILLIMPLISWSFPSVFNIIWEDFKNSI